MIALLPTPPFTLPEAARARHARRALEQAVEHGVALMAALGLPRIVLPDFEPIDPAEIGDAIEQAIAALDEADAPGEDLEDEGHEEPSLGWCERVAQAFLPSGGTRDLELDTADWEHTLGAPERHPDVATMTASWFEPAAGGATRRDTAGHSQVSWAQGSRQDGEREAEAGYDLPEGDDERCASEHDGREPSLGSSDHLDQEHWADGNDGGSDRELDPLDDLHLNPPADPLTRGERFALEQRAKDLRRRVRFGEVSAPRTGNLVPVDMRVLAAAWPSLMGGARG